MQCNINQRIIATRLMVMIENTKNYDFWNFCNNCCQVSTQFGPHLKNRTDWENWKSKWSIHKTQFFNQTASVVLTSIQYALPDFSYAKSTFLFDQTSATPSGVFAPRVLPSQTKPKKRNFVQSTLSGKPFNRARNSPFKRPRYGLITVGQGRRKRLKHAKKLSTVDIPFHNFTNLYFPHYFRDFFLLSSKNLIYFLGV